MGSFLTKEIPKWILIPMVIGFLAFLVWKDIFPLSAHPDLQFQVLGEILELLALIATLALVRTAFAKLRKRVTGEKVSYSANIGSAIAFSMIFIFMDWRKFFPGDHFQLSAGLSTIYGALLAGVFFGLYGVAFAGNYERPTNEEVRSVV